jgi:hypothetical protein
MSPRAQSGSELLFVRCGINDFNGDVEVLLDSVVFCKFNGELSILHQISIDRCRRLKVSKPCGLFECGLVDLIIIDRASHNSKAHMKGIEFETFSESSRGRRMHCCNNRFLFHMSGRRKYQNLSMRARQIIFFIAIELSGTIIQTTSPILFSTD